MFWLNFAFIIMLILTFPDVQTRESALARKQLVHDTCIQRSRICQHPLGGSVGLLRELGCRSTSNGQDITSAAWARGLKARYHHSTSTQKLAYDDYSGTLICGGKRTNVIS